MKKLFTIVALAVIILSCSKGSETPQIPDPPLSRTLEKITVKINPATNPASNLSTASGGAFAQTEWIASSRNYLGTDGLQQFWNEGDRIKIIGLTGVLNGFWEAESGAAASAVFSSADSILRRGVSYRAFFPAEATDAQGTMTYPTDQTQTAPDNSAHLSESAIMQATFTAGQACALNLLTSLIEFRLRNSDTGAADLKLESITISLEGKSDVFYNTITSIGEPVTYADKITLTAADAPSLTTTAAKFWMTARMIDNPAATVLQVKVKTDRGIRIFEPTLPSGGFKPGYRYWLDMDWSGGDGYEPDPDPYPLITWTIPATGWTDAMIYEKTCSATPEANEIVRVSTIVLKHDIFTSAGLNGADRVWGGVAAKNIFLDDEALDEDIASTTKCITAEFRATEAMKITEVSGSLRIPHVGAGQGSPNTLALCYSIGGAPFVYHTRCTFEDTDRRITAAGEPFSLHFSPAIEVSTGKTVVLKLVPIGPTATGTTSRWFINSGNGQVALRIWGYSEEIDPVEEGWKSPNYGDGGDMDKVSIVLPDPPAQSGWKSVSYGDGGATD